MPVPILLKPPVPEILPAYAAGVVLSPPTVSVAAPRITLPPLVPPPVSKPIYVSKPVMSSIALAALAIVTAEFLPNAPLIPGTDATSALRMPAVTVVAPE